MYIRNNTIVCEKSFGNEREGRYVNILVVGIRYFSRADRHTLFGGDIRRCRCAAGCPWSCIASHIPALADRRRVPAGHVFLVREFVVLMNVV